MDGPAASRRHQRVGWTVLLVFATLGLVLESLHGFKVAWLLDVGHETRRLMWRLAHAHGALLGLVNLGFSQAAEQGTWTPRALGTASFALLGATCLLPGGFALGGFGVAGGDPGVGVFLAPAGGLLLLVALGLAARAAWATS